MRRARIARLIVASIVVAAAAVVIVIRMQAPAVPRQSMPVDATALPAGSGPVPPALPVRAANGDAPLSQPAFAQGADDIPALLVRAKAGEVEAMLRLGRELASCQEDKLAELHKSARSLEGGTSKIEEVDYHGKVVRDSKAVAADFRDAITRCDVLPPEERGRSLAWIERAAATGDKAARYTFYVQALEEFVDDAAILANIDEVERRRDVARRFASEDLAACADGVFDMQTHMFDLLGMTDPVERLAIMHADRLMQPDSGNSADEVARFDAEASRVDELALIEARRRGAAMYAHCAP